MMSNQYTPENGDPIPLSDFTLGERYGSEDMYRDMGIVPGSRVAFEKDGVIYTDTVQAVTYSSPEPAIYRELSAWQRFIRRLTPRRIRKSLLIRPARLGTVSVKTGPVDDDVRERYERAQASLAKAGEVIDGLISTESNPRED